MEHIDSLLCFQEPVTGHPEPDESSPFAHPSAYSWSSHLSQFCKQSTYIPLQFKD